MARICGYRKGSRGLKYILPDNKYLPITDPGDLSDRSIQLTPEADLPTPWNRPAIISGKLLLSQFHFSTSRNYSTINDSLLILFALSTRYY